MVTTTTSFFLSLIINLFLVIPMSVPMSVRARISACFVTELLFVAPAGVEGEGFAFRVVGRNVYAVSAHHRHLCEVKDGALKRALLACYSRCWHFCSQEGRKPVFVAGIPVDMVTDMGGLQVALVRQMLAAGRPGAGSAAGGLRV